jgi:transcription antitermination factor NusG
MSINISHWFALYTKPRWEKKVAQNLSDIGIENYCPLNKVVKQWSDRKKIVHEPIFKSYVFVKVPENEKWDLKKVNGVLNFVYWLGKPALIRDEEINTIKRFLNEFSDINIENENSISLNSTVRIKQGVMMNYKGILLELNGNRAKVRIESMGIQLNAQFDKKNIELLHL